MIAAAAYRPLHGGRPGVPARDAGAFPDGIERYEIPGREGEEDCQCARCGSSCDWVRCWECGGDGCVEINCGDDVVPDLQDVACPECRGAGGSWHCLSTPEYCEANPLPLRSLVPSSARSSRWWSDT